MNEPFPIDLAETTELLARFHRRLMDRQAPDWDSFEPESYDPATREHARREWAGRSVAEYASTAQFAQLIHRLTLVGAPVELIGAATRLVQDECRHAELCARMADLLGGRRGYDVPAFRLALHTDVEDHFLAIYRTILDVCCFGEVLSVPMLRSIELVAADPLAKTIANIIGNDEEYHARFGWEALTALTRKLDGERRVIIQEGLRESMGHFERICVGSPELIKRLAGEQIEIAEREGNLGTLTHLEYAAIFYDTMDGEIIPNLEALGFDAMAAWNSRLVPSSGGEVAAMSRQD